MWGLWHPTQALVPTGMGWLGTFPCPSAWHVAQILPIVEMARPGCDSPFGMWQAGHDVPLGEVAWMEDCHSTTWVAPAWQVMQVLDAPCAADMTVIVAGGEVTEVPPEVAVNVAWYVPSALTVNDVTAFVGLPKVAVDPAGLSVTFHWYVMAPALEVAEPVRVVDAAPLVLAVRVWSPPAEAVTSVMKSKVALTE